MLIEQAFSVPSPPDAVWPLLRDPQVIAACFPGAELTGRDDDGAYQGQLTVRFGPTTAIFSGRATLSFDDASMHGAVDARGSDRRGTSRAAAAATVTVVPAPQGSEVAVRGTIDVTGPLGSFATAGGTVLAAGLFEEFAACLAKRVHPGSATEPGGDAASSARLGRAGLRGLVLSLWSWLRRRRSRS